MDGLGPLLEIPNLWIQSKPTELEPAFYKIPSWLVFVLKFEEGGLL